MRKKSLSLELDGAQLHILAMVLMLCDHLWATLIPGWAWLTWIGRITYPIYAFLLVEGYFHTGNLRGYARRLLILAVISEIPFNLMTTDIAIFPFHQNVIWTLLLGLGMIHLNEKAKQTGKPWLRILAAGGTCLLGYLAGTLLMVDYGGAGVLMILTFYFLRQRKWWSLVLQAGILYYISAEMIRGLYVDVTILGQVWKVYQQSFCLLALVPIWLYRGRQGHHSKAFRRLCYGFYPAHMLLLALSRSVIL